MKIAIQGHPTRGKEVIKILENLGGVNRCLLEGNSEISYYFIGCNNMIHCCDECYVRYKKYTLEEFEKEFQFKIGDKVTDHEGDIAIITGFAHIEEKLGYSLQYENGRGTATPGILKPYKEMKEERNITLTLDKAKEWYNKGGELKEIALQAFTEKELNPLPRNWAEFCINHPVKFGETYIGTYSKFISRSVETRDSVYDRYVCPSKKSAEAHLAMIQLEQLRDCWRQGWEPDWNDEKQAKYYICYYHGKFKTSTLYETRCFLSFPTMKMAEEFLKCFRDLIEQAGDLI